MFVFLPISLLIFINAHTHKHTNYKILLSLVQQESKQRKGMAIKNIIIPIFQGEKVCSAWKPAFEILALTGLDHRFWYQIPNNLRYLIWTPVLLSGLYNCLLSNMGAWPSSYSVNVLTMRHAVKSHHGQFYKAVTSW